MLAEACAKETDGSVKIWFGRSQIMDADAHVDRALTAADNKAFGKDGPGAVRSVREWCLKRAIPRNGFLICRASYLAEISGARDGNVGDWGLTVRLANSGASGRFIAEDVGRHRVQAGSATQPGHGVDVHLMFEIARQLEVSTPAHIDARKRLLRQLVEVATTGYLRHGERARAWMCFLSPYWKWKRRLSPSGVAALCMLLTPAFCWDWAIGASDPGSPLAPTGLARPVLAVQNPLFGAAGFSGRDDVDERAPRS
ncbi:hypothetical protein [Variovorax rhizosphaerae]|uniref:Uncharacterized protein n=1 Tax=Variovorax rhizosphaerae TaxID=1836200 RepID=A0ABU8WXZ7_9BURK